MVPERKIMRTEETLFQDYSNIHIKTQYLKRKLITEANIHKTVRSTN